MKDDVVSYKIAIYELASQFFLSTTGPVVLGPQIHMAAFIFIGGICGSNIPFSIVFIYIGHLAIFVWRPVDSLWFYWVVASQGSTRAYFIPRDSHIAARYERLPIGRRQEGGGEVGAPVMKRRLPSLPVCLPTFDRSIQAGGGVGGCSVMLRKRTFLDAS